MAPMEHAAHTRKHAKDLTRLQREIARSVDASPSLVPVFDELFRGMPNLGGTPRRLVGTLERAGLRRGSHVIDLACGKGTLAILVARRLHCRVVAVDACGAFLDHARRSANRAGVARRVSFVQADVRAVAIEIASRRTRFDAACMLGLFGVEEAAPMLRSMLKRGGLYAIDDVFRDDRSTCGDPDFDSVPTRAACQAIFASLGDRVLATDVMSPSRNRALNASLYARLAANSRTVRRRHPALAKPLREFLANQRHANRVLDTWVRPATWIVQRV